MKIKRFAPMHRVSDFQIGDEVFGYMKFKESGAFAEKIVIDSKLIEKKPEHFSFSEAAALPISAMTA